MTRASTLGELIKNLRQNAGYKSRAALARRLGVNRSSVVAWETDVYKPNLADCLKITGLMETAEEKVGFLEQAGVDILSLADLAVALEMSSSALSKSDRVVPVADLAGEGVPIYVSKLIISSPASIRYFRVPEGSTGGSLSGGDIYFLDISRGQGKKLGPFWGERILVEIAAPSPSAYVPPRTHEVGRLRLSPVPQAGEQAWFEAMLDPLSDYLHLSSAGALEHQVSARLGVWTGKARNRPPSSLRGRAEREMKILPGFRILGCVIGWQKPQEDEGE